MKAAVLRGLRKIEIEDVPEPRPGPGEVKVRVRSVGVCGSDVHYYIDGRIGDQVVRGPQIVGHEFGGVVEELGPGVTDIAPGTRVAVEPSMNCGKCYWCERGLTNICPNVKFYGTPPVQGSFCEHVCHPRRLVFPVPDEMSDDEAAMLEPLGVAIHAVQRARVEAADTVAVLGSGPIGLLTLQVAKASGASRIFATDIRPYRLEFAGRLGAEAVANPEETDVAEWIKGLTGGMGVDVIFECAGEPSTVEECVAGVRIGGRVGLVGIPRVDSVSFDPHTARRRELDILNVRRSRFAVEPGIELVRRKQVDAGSLVTHTFPLDKVGEALELVHNYADGVVKAVVRVSEAK